MYTFNVGFAILQSCLHLKKQYYWEPSGDMWKVIFFLLFSFLWIISHIFASPQIFHHWTSHETIQKTHLFKAMLILSLLLLHYLFSQWIPLLSSHASCPGQKRSPLNLACILPFSFNWSIQFINSKFDYISNSSTSLCFTATIFNLALVIS